MAVAQIAWVIEELDIFLLDVTNRIVDENKELVERVRDEMRLILDFVADKKLEEGSSLKYWISDVVEIAQDTYFFILVNSQVGYYESLTLLKAICRGLRGTRKRIFQLGNEGANKSNIALSSPREGDEYVVGLEQDVESVVIKTILRERIGCYPICIVGMAGVGKTPLARKVYNHPTTVDRFELRAWVNVSRELSNKEVLMKLILQMVYNKDQSALLEKMENADNGSLQEMLQLQMQGKNILIVLDDIGNMPYIDSIIKVLPGQGEETRLLITSRFQSIKYRARINTDIHIMKPLDDDRSWQLFSKLLLFGNQQFPKQLERKGKEMLRSCGGLPLSIKEVATQFVMKRQEGSEWEELLESVDLSTTFAILESIYHEWSPQLKSCFLYLSFFKKGTTIRREKLIQVWTAGQVIPLEEVIPLKEDYKDFEEANFYLDFLEEYKTTLMKLVDELIIEVDLNKDRCVKCIRINASFHKLSMVKATEEMVFETLKKGEVNPNPTSSREPRHRAIYCSRDEFNHFTDHDERLVSLFYHGGGCFDASEPYWKRFEQLRILDFEGFGLKILPEAISALTELRYLGLRDNYIRELPQSLGRLKNLEVLDIALNFTIEVPNIVWEISSLRHLYMSDIICRKPLKSDTLKKLVTLTYISINNWTYRFSSLQMMTSLRKLGIEELDENSDISKLFAPLANLKNLDYLILKGFRFRSLPSLHGLGSLNYLSKLRLDGLITKLPSADNFPPNIYHLSLIDSRLDEDPLPELAKLENLLYLRLKNAYTGQQMVIPNERFYIEVLRIEELWHLKNIKVENCIRRLMRLEIRNCPYLETIPEYIITYHVQEVKMLTTRRLAAKIRKLDHLSKIEHMDVDIQP